MNAFLFNIFNKAAHSILLIDVKQSQTLLNRLTKGPSTIMLRKMINNKHQKRTYCNFKMKKIMKYTEKITKQLNNLLEKNYDAEKGYETAADNVDSIDLKNYFKDRAKERYDFGHELKNEIKLYGETPEKGTSFTADAHRVWMNFRTALSSNDEDAILKETIRGEESFVEEYNEILEISSLPESTRRLILKQRSIAISALEDVKKFESVEA